MENDIVQLWLRKDPIRWLAGALAGIVAGAVALGVAMAISTSGDLEIWFPMKLIATIVLGPSATQVGMDMKNIGTGLFIVEAFCAIFGMIFAHFTTTNMLKALWAMGVVWGIFSWIFIWNLFLPSFRPIFAARLPAGPVMPICLAYGLSLSCVAFFDSMLRPAGNSRH